MIYKLLTALLLGMILGIWFWEQVGVGDQYKAYISKLKQKGTNNDQDVVFKPVLSTSDTKQGKLFSKRKLRRIDKRKQKAIRRLNK